MGEIVLTDGDLLAHVRSDTGQLVRLSHRGHEFMHPGGREEHPPDGWGESEIIMWPIVGPAADDTVWLRTGDKERLDNEFIHRKDRDAFGWARKNPAERPYHLTQHGIA